MRRITILIYAGFILNCISLIFVAGQYFSLLRSEVVIQALEPGKDIVADKIMTLPARENREDLLLTELKSRHEQIAGMQSSLEQMVSSNKHNMQFRLLLVSISTTIFAALIFMAKAYD